MKLAVALIVPLVAFATFAAPVKPPASPPGSGAADRAGAAVAQALAAGADPVAQARNLAKLAWPEGKRDEAVAERARQELENFGGHAMVALREAVNSVKPEYTIEVVKTVMGAQRYTREGNAPEYLPVYLDAIWVGNRQARSLAMFGVLADRPALAVQPMIDAALDDPALAPQVVQTLGTLRYEQARFYLEKVMMEGPPPLRPAAASSLAQIGGAALGPLKNALKAPSRDARLLAARALLPAATDRELGALYEYIRDHGDDDPGLTQALKASAANIEKAIAARDASEAASAPKDF